MCDDSGVAELQRREARALLVGMGEEPPPYRPAPGADRNERNARPVRDERGPRPERPREPRFNDTREPRDFREARPSHPAQGGGGDGPRKARELALTGRWADALVAAPRGRDPESVVLRSWLRLEAAIAGPAETREGQLAALAADLRKSLDLPKSDDGAPERMRAERPERPPRVPPEPGAAPPPRTDFLAIEGALVEALQSGESEAIDAAIQGFHRGWRAVQAAEAALGSAAPGAIAALVSKVAGDQRMPEATTLLVKAAALGDQASADMLVASERLGGTAASTIVALVRVAAEAGFVTSRVLRGVTKRERTDHAALEPLAERCDGLWRVLVGQGELRGELWWIEEAPPEVRAATPFLLLDARRRVVCVPVASELLAWWATSGGPPAVGWTGDEGAAVAEALGAWT